MLQGVLESAQTLSEWRNVHVYLERTPELSVQRKCPTQKRLSEAEAEMDTRNWERRNADIALYETDRELESQRLELYQANQCADQAQREKSNKSGELETRNRFFQEGRAKKCQEIEDTRRICCEGTGSARQLRIDELSLQQERNSSTVSQLLTQIQDLQNKVNSSADARDFYDPETASSSG